MITFNRTGYTSILDALEDIVEDMISNGFTAVYDDRINTGLIIMEPDITVDPLQDVQPWRIAINTK